MKLRGHHLICRLGFQGLGYDKKFTKTMEEVLTVLNLNPNLNIKVITTTDILCAACPQRERDICKKEKKDQHIKEKDEFVLQVLQLTENKIYTLQEINQKISSNFTETKREELCHDCEWNNYDYCQQGITALKKSVTTN